MIAQRFRTIGLTAGVAGAALVFYLVSQWVAAERAGLDKVNRQIASAERDIRMLGMEVDARGRMGQLERWNREVLALTAPRPRQFVGSEVQLASLNRPAPQPLPAATTGTAANGVEMAAYRPVATAEAPHPVMAAAAVAPLPQQPMIRPATFVRPKPDSLDAAPVGGLRKASLLPDDIAGLAATEATDAKPARARP